MSVQKVQEDFEVVKSVGVDKTGRILLPASMRKRIGLVPGSRVTVRCDDNGISISTARQGLAKVRALWNKYGDGSSLVEALKEMRREDASKE